MREIRDGRARVAQGRRAGFVSQAIAAVVDAAWIVAEYFLVLVAFGALNFLLTSASFEVPKPDTWVSVLLLFVIGVTTLHSAWSGSGRAPGMALLGLRVVTPEGAPVPSRRAFWRAVLAVATLGLGVVTVLFSRRNASLYDWACKTAVVYEWRPAMGTGGP